ncbi:unnamed protein product, partial [Ectocarpus fasciculatus]
ERFQFLSECTRRWGPEVAAKVEGSCRTWHQSPTRVELPLSDDAGLDKKISDAIELLVPSDQRDIWRSSINKAIKVFENSVMSKYPDTNVYLAVATSCPSHINTYSDDTLDFIKQYIDTVSDTPVLNPAMLLATARLCSSEEIAFKASCLRRCNIPSVARLMTDQEKLFAATAQSQPLPPSLYLTPDSSLALETPADRWERLKQETDAKPSAALDDLMKLIGLNSVKLKALEIYESILAEQSLPAERWVPQTFNFALLGNPGTGKTTVGKLLGKMLFEVGVRSTDTFLETTGEKLSRMSADDVDTLIVSAVGGSLFIDEAYALDPVRNVSAAAVAMQLLDAAESRRTELTIILGGYKEDMEGKLFDFNDGFNRRFNYSFNFDDYTESELAAILKQLCTSHKWPPSDENVIDVAARRVSRGRGHKAFGNAGAVRVLFEKAYKKRNPKLRTAMNDLEDMVGLDAVKREIRSLVNLAAVNYERELNGSIPYEVSLNRLFLGNPGTGKTTVAKLYGRILKEIGMLSDGSTELKQPSDLIGSAVGEAEKTTSALIKRCRGKVLIIDEAYALSNSTFGSNALDTLTGLVQGSPGEDIAVVMIGYEKDMKKMLRGQNSGLTRRFSFEDAFKFEDFSDEDLERVIVKLVQGNKLKASRSVRQEVIKELAVQRSRPNFGNAGAAVTMVAAAKQRLASRDPHSTDFTLADFGLGRPHLDALSALVQQWGRDWGDKTQYLNSYIFVGSPGTGKTTVACLFAYVLHAMGLLSVPKVVTCSGLDLQGSSVGQTKDVVNKQMREAVGGVLFIDEAYSLCRRGGGNTDTFSQEAMDQLVALMTEPEHLHKTVVILAGYKNEMDRMLSSANPGVRSRFTERIEFPDWDADDCANGIVALCSKRCMDVQESALSLLKTELSEVKKRPGWANARDSDTMFRYLYEARAVRCSRVAEIGLPQFMLPDVEEFEVELFEEINPSPSDSDVFALLLKLCVHAGYDKTHETRQKLLEILEAVQQRTGKFPDDIMLPIMKSFGLTEAKVTSILTPQVGSVISGLRNAIRAEEERQAELAYALQQEVLQRSGICPAGFLWHREGSGWRCGGGSHRVEDL